MCNAAESLEQSPLIARAAAVDDFLHRFKIQRLDVGRRRRTVRPLLLWLALACCISMLRSALLGSALLGSALLRATLLRAAGPGLVSLVSRWLALSVPRLVAASDPSGVLLPAALRTGLICAPVLSGLVVLSLSGCIPAAPSITMSLAGALGRWFGSGLGGLIAPLRVSVPLGWSRLSGLTHFVLIALWPIAALGLTTIATVCGIVWLFGPSLLSPWVGIVRTEFGLRWESTSARRGIRAGRGHRGSG